MQDDHGRVGAQHGPVEAEAGRAPFAEQHAGQQRRPGAVPDRRQHPPQQRDRDRRRERAPALEEGGEGVAGALQRREAHPGGRAEQQAVHLLVVAAAPRDHQHAEDLGELLDDPDEERGLGVQLADEEGLEGRGGERA